MIATSYITRHIHCTSIINKPATRSNIHFSFIIWTMICRQIEKKMKDSHIALFTIILHYNCLWLQLTINVAYSVCKHEQQALLPGLDI